MRCPRRRRRFSKTPPSISSNGSPTKFIPSSPNRKAKAFVSGDGANKPKDFLSYPTVPDATWSFGNVGYVATGASGAFGASNPSDVLFDLVYSLRAGYRPKGKFVMNRRTQSALRKFKTTTGEYIWEPPSASQVNPVLMGFPVVDAENMPDIGVGAFAVAFGDFERGYIVVDRIGIRILRDPIPTNPMCCSTRPSASAAACRISRRSNC